MYGECVSFMSDYVALWNRFPTEAREKLLKLYQIREYKKGEFVYRTGQEPTGIYLVAQGLVALVGISNKGAEHFLRLFRSGFFFGHRSLLANEVYHANAICLEPTVINFFDKKHVRSLIQEFPELQLILIETLAKELKRAEIQRIEFMEQDVVARTASAVVYLKDIHPSRSWTRQEIASFCSSTTPSVIRAMSELEKRGFIKQEGRGFEILNREALLNLGIGEA